MIRVRVVGVDGEEQNCSDVAHARKVALDLSARFPQRWVDAKDEHGTIVHRLEPRSIVDAEPDPDDVTLPLPEQEPMF